jgi:acetoin utilization protein AcuB
MTPQPWTVQLDDSVAVARRMIAEREIHHLPVLDGGAVVGIVTERELARAADRLGTVADVVAPVRRVDIEASLEDVLDDMVTHHSDAVVVTRDAGVEGIFTASDAMRVLRDLLRRRRARAGHARTASHGA